MIPEVSHLENVEMIRDGGSFAATFSNSAGERLILFFPIKHTESGGFFEPRQHLSPVIIDCDPLKRPEGHSEWSGPTSPISWDEARSLLANLAANKHSQGEMRRSLYFEEWFQNMADIAKRDGAPAA